MQYLQFVMILVLFIAIVIKIKQPTLRLPRIRLPRISWGETVVSDTQTGMVTMSEAELKAYISTVRVDAFECGYVAGKNNMVYQTTRMKTIRVGYMVKGLFACDGVYGTKGYVHTKKAVVAATPAPSYDPAYSMEPPPGY